MSENGYNNWKNRETWNVALWLDNEESFYYPVKNGLGKIQKVQVKHIKTLSKIFLLMKTVKWVQLQME